MTGREGLMNLMIRCLRGGGGGGCLEGTHGPTRGSRLASYDSLLGPTVVIGARDKKEKFVFGFISFILLAITASRVCTHVVTRSKILHLPSLYSTP